MKLSVVILCWNDLNVISDCIQSIIAGTHSTEYEIIVSDNGSSDGSSEFIRKNFPPCRVVENGKNLRFALGNNVGIKASCGEYVLILNPDTIIHDGSLDRLIQFADRHPEAGAFGCRVLNPDGSYQISARPFPTIRGEWIAATFLRPLAYLANYFVSDTYTGWNGDTEREVDWQSGCCVMFRGDLLKQLGGFDEQFFYYYEEVDLCKRVRMAGRPILFTPNATITHLGGQSTRRFKLAFELDKYITRYRYFYKYYGRKGVKSCRRVSLASLRIRLLGHSLLQILRPGEQRMDGLELIRASIEWNKRIDPVRLVEAGEEPDFAPRAAARIT